MDPGKEFLGLGRRGSGFTSETWFWCCAGCTQQHPGSTCTAGCGWSWTSTAWMLLQAPRWAGAQLQRCPAALQPCCSAHPQHLLKKSGWAVWLCLLHLSNPWGIDRAPASLSLVVRMHYPRLFGQAAVSRTTEDQLCSRWVLVNPHCYQAEDAFTECWNHGIWCYFYANTNRWDTKGILHLHAF